jgi:putrescine transport system permease protein
VRLGVSPKINALATLWILAVTVAALVAWWVLARGERKRRNESVIRGR